MFSCFFATGCFGSKKGDVVEDFTNRVQKAKAYHINGELEIVNNEESYLYDVDVSYKDDDYDYEELRRINDCLVNKTGLQLGLTHAEYINEKGKWYLVEIGCRGGGNLISSHIVPMQSGVDNYEILISQLLNEEYDDVDENTLWKNKYSVLKFLDTEVNEGVVEDIIGVDELSKSSTVKVYKINYSIGDTVNLSDDSKRLGFYVADTDQKDELTDLIKRIKSNVKLQIV